MAEVEKPKKKKANNLTSVCFRWGYGGDNIYLVGSFTNWTEHLPMEKNGDEATKILQLEKKEHYYKFIVNGDWRFAPDQQTVADHNGNINNVIDLTDCNDGCEEEESEEEKDESYNTCIPMNGYSQEIPKTYEFTQEPPMMPFNLSKSILDESINDIPLQNPEYSREFEKEYKDTKIKSIFKDKDLPVPSHISLNHAFFTETNCPNTSVCAITQSIMRKKYVTTIHYTDLKSKAVRM